MTDPALQSQPLVPALEYGYVRDCSARHLRIETRHGDLRGSRAVGCLVAPRPGDRVLISLDADGECFVLSVLTRETPGADIDLSGPSTIRVRDGGLVLAADETIAAVSRSLSLTAEQGRAEFDSADISSRRLQGPVQAVAGDGQDRGTIRRSTDPAPGQRLPVCPGARRDPGRIGPPSGGGDADRAGQKQHSPGGRAGQDRRRPDPSGVSR